MDIRYVTRTGKDYDGDITKLCNPGEFWSPVSKETAITQIENNIYEYRVKVDYKEVKIIVQSRGYIKYLKTEADTISSNNLDNLPDC